MADELTLLTSPLFHHLELTCSNCTKDLECEEYHGHTCTLSPFVIKYRQAKITPKKIGQFVTLWQRNEKGITEPFTTRDPFDFYIIMTEDHNQIGCFIFPQSILGEKGILTTPKQDGKRGFRVYPDWDLPTSKQALQTQKWQSLYFIDCTNLTPQALEKARNIMQPY
ncbi:MepB family protein [Myroides fluvii]|uniref:MepB family protein n=1 Tax=Myroides fluvii TaxID=2572594 RepID=UPI00131B2C01|nr:MepB family protein [Myroides fluvii]